MITRLRDIAGLKVTIMGLGLHGGGAATARFFASHGAEVTVTDLRGEDTLAESIASLRGFPIRFVLGKHETKDFSGADMVVKNPAVPGDSPYLAAAPVVETDISIFLRLSSRPIIAVTGSKGKSTTASALARVLGLYYPDTKLGGNITVSPLTFAESCALPSADPVVLELSSWQLADIPDISLLQPEIAVVTNLLHDHQDRYSSMEAYAADKKRIFQSQREKQATITSFDDPFCRRFAVTTPGSPYIISSTPFAEVFDGGFLRNNRGIIRFGGVEEECLPETTALPGAHNKLNLLSAAAALRIFGLTCEEISAPLAEFPGIEHRLELVRVISGVSWYNDSAATIPEASAAAVESFKEPVHLITGGTDKQLDFEVFRRTLFLPDSYHLLEGSATDKLIPMLKEAAIPYRGPFSSLSEAVESAYQAAKEGSVVLFSPASTSFGMFLNEFDRGNKFKKIVETLE
ncbi:MAG: UDP-N-acetylmuramoyl-L-alanine--D-glutamate ligase [Spirochaetaceae bacterium]